MPKSFVSQITFVVVFWMAEGREQQRYQNVPVNPKQSEVIFCEPIETARALPAIKLVVKLVAVEEMGERVLGQYTFNHTPS